MKYKPFMVTIETKNSFIIEQAKDREEVMEWYDGYKSNDSAIAISVYQKNGVGYERVICENKRRIGF